MRSLSSAENGRPAVLVCCRSASGARSTRRGYGAVEDVLGDVYRLTARISPAANLC
jgi:hypothetical protein